MAHEGEAPDHSVEELVAVVEVTTAVVILNLLNQLGLPAQLQCEIVRDQVAMHTAAWSARDYVLTTPG